MNFATITALLTFLILMGHSCVEAQRCPTVCPENYDPVCGSLRLRNGATIQCTFSNQCKLNARRCVRRESWGALLGKCQWQSAQCNNFTG
uniref:Kazal-like domain-containing protein n=1 Tax=Stomoxys calcitrans TaxID=35570 RepID=A0A1I8NY68_STOCA